MSKRKQKGSFENDGLILIYFLKKRWFCKVLTFVKGLFYSAFSVFTLVGEHIGMLVLFRAACRFLGLFFSFFFPFGPSHRHVLSSIACASCPPFMLRSRWPLTQAGDWVLQSTAGSAGFQRLPVLAWRPRTWQEMWLSADLPPLLWEITSWTL